MTDKFAYHERMSGISKNDESFLKMKDRSYGASWKESGRSAWFMCKRMIDRLTNMMSRPPVPGGLGFNLMNVDDTIRAVREASFGNNTIIVKSPGTADATASMFQHLRDCYLAEDLLAVLERDMRVMQATAKGPHDESADGTPLAVVRDLRRYLLLAEAEAAQRVFGDADAGGARTFRMPPDVKEQVYSAILSDARAAAEAGCVDEGTRVLRKEPALAMPYGLEDSNKHAPRDTMAPWAVSEKWRFENGYGESSGRKEQFDRWWALRMRGQWRLREHVVDKLPQAQISHLYSCVTNVAEPDHWILNIEECPTTLRSTYPKFPEEVNLKELTEQPEWTRFLYVKVEGDDKWRMKPGCEAWSKWW